MRSGRVAAEQAVQLAHHLDAVADGVADPAKRLQPLLQVRQADQLAAAGGGIDVEGPDLHGLVALGEQALGERAGIAHEGHLVVIGARRDCRRRRCRGACRAGVEGVARTGVVDRHAEARTAAQRLVDRHALALAGQIPQRDVDGAGRRALQRPNCCSPRRASADGATCLPCGRASRPSSQGASSSWRQVSTEAAPRKVSPRPTRPSLVSSSSQIRFGRSVSR